MIENKKKALIIGGTGIIGNPLLMRLIKYREYEVHSISLNRASNPTFPDSVRQYTLDINSDDFEDLARNLNSIIDHWDVVIDLISFDSDSAKRTYDLFKNDTQHFISISTTLVYDRSVKNDKPISEENSLAKEGEMGGYVDGKLRLEKFWHGVDDVNWTILRPYHIVGKKSLLGCIPECNRDPEILKKIKNGVTLNLCNGGDIFLNYIHPMDVAEAISKIIGNYKTFKKSYNLVNPEVILAKDYYQEIAKQLNSELKIDNISFTKIWNEMNGWELTILPHIYDMSKMNNDISYIPDTPLSTAIEDAIKSYDLTSVEQSRVNQRMNKLPRPKHIDWL